MKKYKFIIFFLLLLFAIGCTRKEVNDTIDATTGIGAFEKKIQSDEELAKIHCIQLCKNEITKDADISSGPCIGNPIAGLQNWVCDVAHNPRQPVDNKSENQCSAFRDGKAKHFIEVDENCGFIKSY